MPRPPLTAVPRVTRQGQRGRSSAQGAHSWSSAPPSMRGSHINANCPVVFSLQYPASVPDETGHGGTERVRIVPKATQRDLRAGLADSRTVCFSFKHSMMHSGSTVPAPPPIPRCHRLMERSGATELGQLPEAEVTTKYCSLSLHCFGYMPGS